MTTLLIWCTLAFAGTWERVESLRDDTAPIVAPLARRVDVQALAAEVLRYAAHGDLPPGLVARAAALDLVAERDGDVLLLHGAPGHGDGLVAVRLGQHGGHLVLVAPHAWNDLGTGALASEWFDVGYARALVINTVHRNRGTGPDAVDDAADVAHERASAFQALTLGVADGLIDPLLIEIHGFSARRGDFAGVVADGGTLQPARARQAVSDLLDAELEGEIVPGRDVWLLAATKNAQGRALSGEVRFVHVELSRRSRRSLRRDPIRRSAVGVGLARIAEDR